MKTDEEAQEPSKDVPQQRKEEAKTPDADERVAPVPPPLPGQPAEPLRTRLLLVLIPVVVGALIGALLSFSATITASAIQQRQAERKSRAEQLQRMMVLCNDTLVQAITASYALLKLNAPLGHLTTGGHEVAAYLPPVFEMRAMAALYFPELEQDVDRVLDACINLNQVLGKEKLATGLSKESGDASTKINTTVRELQKKIIEMARKNRG